MEPVRVPTLPGASFRLPPQLEGLRRLAYNMWWSWNPRARALFSRIDGLAFSRYRNPIEVLSQPIAWSELLDDPAFMAECSQVLADFDR
jgi:starch phosphorylase